MPSATLSTVGSITFNSTAGAYTLAANSGSAGNGSALGVSVSIVNNSLNTQTINAALNFSASRSIDAAAGGIDIGGVISGLGGFAKNGSNILTLMGNNSFTGDTTINTGTVEIGSPGRLGGGNYTGSISNSGELIYSGTNNQTLSGIISGTGALTLNASSRLTLSANNSFTGNTTITAGTVEIGAPGRLGQGDYLGSISSNGLLIYSGTSNQTLSGIISGTGALTHNATSRLTLSANNTFSGNTTITAGIVEIGAPGRLGGGSYSANIAISGTLIYSGTNNQALSGSISGAGALTHNASSRLTLSANNTYTGNTTINTGTVEIGPPGGLGGGNYTGRIINSGELIYSGTANQTLSGIISGTGALTHNASSRLTLSANNTYTGNTTIDAGIVEIGSAGRLRGGNYTGRIINSGELIYSGTNNQTLSGIISGTGALTHNASSRLTLSANNTYTGDTTINTGLFEITTTGRLGGGNYSGNITNSGSLVFGSNSNQTISGLITGNGAITKNGSGTLTLTGNNNYSGNTTIYLGTLVIGNANAAGSGKIFQIDSTSLLKFDTAGTITNDMSVFNVQTLQTVALSGAISVNNATWDVETGATLTINGSVSGSGGVTKNGNGTLVLSGSNSYAATTTINAGTLQAAHASALGSNNAVQIYGGTLLVSAVDALAGKQIEMTSNSTGLRFSGNYNGSVGRLTLSANSIIDLGSGSTNLSFHEVFMGIYYLNFYNWTGTTLWEGGTGADTDQVYFGTTGGGNYDLSKVRFYSGTTSDSFLGTGFDLGFDAGFAGNHIIPVPEPETWSVGCLLLLCGSFWMWRSRRSKMAISG
jgi:autotransporter-associated beta strand protein